MANDQITVKVRADAKGFKQELAGAQSTVQKLQPAVEKTATAVSGLGSALGQAVPGGAGAAVGALSNMAQLLGAAGPFGAAIAGAIAGVGFLVVEFQKAKKASKAAADQAIDDAFAVKKAIMAAYGDQKLTDTEAIIAAKQIQRQEALSRGQSQRANQLRDEIRALFDIKDQEEERLRLAKEKLRQDEDDLAIARAEAEFRRKAVEAAEKQREIDAEAFEQWSQQWAEFDERQREDAMAWQEMVNLNNQLELDNAFSLAEKKAELARRLEELQKNAAAAVAADERRHLLTNAQLKGMLAQEGADLAGGLAIGVADREQDLIGSVGKAWLDSLKQRFILRGTGMMIEAAGEALMGNVAALGAVGQGAALVALGGGAGFIAGQLGGGGGGGGGGGRSTSAPFSAAPRASAGAATQEAPQEVRRTVYVFNGPVFGMNEDDTARVVGRLNNRAQRLGG